VSEVKKLRHVQNREVRCALGLVLGRLHTGETIAYTCLMGQVYRTKSPCRPKLLWICTPSTKTKFHVCTIMVL